MNGSFKLVTRYARQVMFSGFPSLASAIAFSERFGEGRAMGADDWLRVEEDWHPPFRDESGEIPGEAPSA